MPCIKIASGTPSQTRIWTEIMAIEIFAVKGRAVEVVCSTDIALWLGAVPSDGHSFGRFLLMRTSDNRKWLWRFLDGAEKK
jgi:hypothetical protein